MSPLWIAAFFAAAPTEAADLPLLHVAPSDLRASLEGELRAELSSRALTDDRKSADLIVDLQRVDRSLKLEMRDPAGQLVLERQIGLESGLAPAMRVAVLAVVEAARRTEPRGEVQVNLQPPAAASPAPIARMQDNLQSDEPPKLWLGAGTSMVTFGSPGTALFGVAFSASYEVFGGAIGARGEYYGPWGTLRREGPILGATTTSLSGTPSGGAAFAVVEWPLLRFQPAELRVEASVGARLLQIDANGGWNVGETIAPTESFQQWIVAGRLGASLAAKIAGPLRAQLAFGLEARNQNLKVELPVFFLPGNEPFESGAVVPWGELQLQVGLF